MKTNDLYWIAGILEGEGYFGLHGKGYLSIQVTMTDKDVIDRYSSIVNFGSRCERLLPSGKTAYGWRSNHQSNNAGLMMTLLSLMGERRKNKIMECLERWKLTPLPKKQWTHCKHGHELLGDNLKIVQEGKYTKRRCVECGRQRQIKYQLAQSVRDGCKD